MTLLKADLGKIKDLNSLVGFETQLQAAVTKRDYATTILDQIDNIKTLVDKSAATTPEKEAIIAAIDSGTGVLEAIDIYTKYQTEANNMIAAVKLNVQALCDKTIADPGLTPEQKDEFEAALNNANSL